MALQSQIQITIAGQSIPTFKKLLLHQEIDAHHIFELHCRVDVLESITSELLSETRNFLGEAITIQISSLANITIYKELEFKGVVTEVKSIKGFHHSGGDVLVIKGYSSSILADDGPHYSSFQQMNIKTILNNIFEGHDQSKLETVVNPTINLTLLYTVQHHESTFRFASRLAAQYGEWFYYNGTKLLFGLPKKPEEITLTYGMDLQEFSLQLAPKSNKYNYFTNDFLNNQEHQKKTSEVSGLNGYVGFSSEKSNVLYAKETNVWVNSFNDEHLQQRLDTLVEKQKQATELNQVELKGSSDNPGIGIGKLITITNADGDYGKYRVIAVTHSSNENGKYQNQFTALSADSDVYPNTNIQAFPYSDAQVAKVKANNDPEGLGRIQVEFSWQKLLGEITPWLRVVTPHAGGDKGFHFIPEVGEEVMVGFEGGNAERPYVLGSMYNGSGKAQEFQTDANDIKAIRTRSGHTIELNDTDGEEKINIYDNEGSIITFNTQEKSLYIQATENIELSAKNIKMIAEEDIEIQAQGEIKTASEGDTSVISQSNLQLQSSSDTTIKSNGSIEVEATSDASLKGMNTVIEGQTAAELNGAQAKVNGSGMAEVSGGIVKIN